MAEIEPRRWMPEMVYTGREFKTALAISSDDAGRITSLGQAKSDSVIHLAGRAAFPGLINAHSHAFQRVIRGRTEYRTHHPQDSFWTWREMMYRAAGRLSPDDVFDASRMAFLEMALSGITTVGEFHYLHHAPKGERYNDPDLLAKQVVQAARDIGLKIALLHVAYARSGYRKEANPRQARFIESDAEGYLKRVSYLQSYLNTFSGQAWLGVAPHSVRAVPLDYLKQIIHFANERQLMVHMHVAERRADVLSCIEEYGVPPVNLLEREDLMNERFTAVHAIHLTSGEVMALAHTKSKVCACPTTERNLGDGIVPVDAFFKAGIPVCLGSDSHAQIDLLEDARELEYHLRLKKMERAVLASESGDRAELGARLFRCATTSGAASLGFDGGLLEQGHPADFFTVDLDDPSIAGSSPEDLLANVVFSLSRAAVRDVIVGGQTIVKDGRHAKQEEVIERFKALQERLWS